MMKGVWVKRAVKPHTCPKPRSLLWRRVYPGSVWRCGCGQEWRTMADLSFRGFYWEKVVKDSGTVSTTWSPGVPLPRLYPLTDTNTI